MSTVPVSRFSPALALAFLVMIHGSVHAQGVPDISPSDMALPDTATSDSAISDVAVSGVGVRGRVVDDTGEVLIAATVEVIAGGSGEVAYSDEDGAFELALPPGDYLLRVSMPMFTDREVAVTVPASGGMASVDVALAIGTEVVQMEGRIERGAEGMQLEIRRNAAAVSDVLSKQEIARTPDSSASDAVKRVPSVTVEDDKYVVIRGLGDRYATTLLNGVPLPSPEPDRQAVPLDLFPTSLLSNLIVTKSYTAELPGTFGGGSLALATDAYPLDFKLRLELSTSLNTATSFRDINTQPGGSLDFFGYDDGARAVPGDLPADTTMSELSAEERERLGESMSNRWVAGSDSAMMGLGIGAEIGDTVDAGGRRLGYLGTFSFGRSPKLRQTRTGKTRISNGALEYRDTFDGVHGVDEARVGALGNVGYELGDGHSIDLVGLYSHTGEASTSTVSGFNDNAGSLVEETRLQFLERAMSFFQLAGSHRLAAASRVELDWQTNVSFSSRDEPDTRDIVYLVANDGTRTYYNESASGQSFIASLDQRSLGGGFDLSLPLARARLRAGASAQRTDRSFLGRRLRFDYLSTTGMPAHTRLPADQIFSAATIGTSFALEERTLQSDGYDGTLDVLGTYASAELEAAKRLRVIAGLRFEYSSQSLSSGNPTAVDSVMERESMKRSDPALLPALNLVYAASQQTNLRAAYSYTLARPLFRELAPFIYYDPIERVGREGNPGLAMTRIHNADLRWEWFPGDREVLAVSGFYKRFEDPIEQVIYNAAGSRTFENAAGASAFGAELEARLSLGRVARALDDLRIGANLAIIDSAIELSEAQQGSQTSSERPLQGQAPYAFNVGLTYSNPAYADVTVLYNVIGAAITDVGTQGLPDIYRQPFHKLDLVVQRALQQGVKLELTAVNLLDAAVESRQENMATLRYEPGVSVSVGLSWTP